MRQGHFVIMFLVVYIICFSLLSVEQQRFDAVNKERQKVEEGLLEAVENAAWELITVMAATSESKQQAVENAFFEALYAAFGIYDDKEAQEQLHLYVPLLVLAEEDGVWFYHAEEDHENGTSVIHQVWSEKYDFSFPENCTEAKKKGIVAKVLEEKASKYITEHNYIASQYGLEYSFYVPEFLQNTAERLQFPMLIAVFQGWPLTAAGNVVYENCIDAGVYLQETEEYIIEFPVTLEETFRLYHKPSCTEISEGNGRFSEGSVTKQEAIWNFGAYPCEICNQ